MGVGLEKVGIRGVCGVRPAWPRVMSYPALIEKLDLGGPTGGADMTGPEGLMGEARGGIEGDGAEKGAPLVRAAATVGGVENWEDWGGAGPRGLLKAGEE